MVRYMHSVPTSTWTHYKTDVSNWNEVCPLPCLYRVHLPPFLLLHFKMSSEEEDWYLCMIRMMLVQQSSVPMATIVRTNILTDIRVPQWLPLRGRLWRNCISAITVRRDLHIIVIYKGTSASTLGRHHTSVTTVRRSSRNMLILKATSTPTLGRNHTSVTIVRRDSHIIVI